MDLIRALLLVLSGVSGLFAILLGLLVLIAEHNTYPLYSDLDLFARFLVAAAFATSWAMLITSLLIGR